MTEPVSRRDRRQANRANRPGQPPPEQQPYGYQGATAYAAGQSDPGTDYENKVLGGQYLTPNSNPYLKSYGNELSRQFQGNLNRGLSAVSSPFMSGATLGQSGIHADVRGRYAQEGMQDLGGQLNQLYSGAYEGERDRQQQTSGQISDRTQGMRNVAAQNYGTDVAGRTSVQTAHIGARAQVQSTRIQADSMLEQARMAQQLGYDQLASDLMYKYEQLNQQAIQMEQDWILRSGALGSDVMRGFSEVDEYGRPISTGEGITQGILGGGATGAGVGSLFGKP